MATSTLTSWLMTLDEFQQTLRGWQKADADMFALEGKPASGEAIAAAQEALGVILPPDYVEYLQAVGGGRVGTEVIFDVLTTDDEGIVEHNATYPIPEGFVAFSENGCGDTYLFRVREGRCESGVWFYDHEDGSVEPTGAADVYEHLVTSITSSIPWLTWSRPTPSNESLLRTWRQEYGEG